MQYLFPLGLGLALALTLPPISIGPVSLGILAPIPLIWLLTKGGFRFGLLAGIGFWAFHVIWLPQSFGLNFGIWGAIIFIPMMLIKALFFAVLFALTTERPLMRLGGWVLMEWLTSLGELAFPWGFLGYSLVDAPGRILASAGGVYLLSLSVLAVAFGLSRNRYWVVLAWAALWLIPLPAAQPDKTALLVQGNIDVFRKFQGLADVDNLYLNLTQKGLQEHPDTEVVVWPETAVFGFKDPAYTARLAQVLGERNLVSGYESGFNRVVRFQGGQLQEHYDKNRLVPFGESFPLRKLFAPIYSFVFTQMGLGNLGDRPPGSGYQTLGPYGAYICYESVFPSVSRNLVRNGAEVLELGSNDSWYGTSFGAEQHFDMGRLRAVETGRWVLRAGNDGVTASVDPYGRVVARFPRHQEGYLAVPYAHITNQTLYVRFGDWAVALAVILGLFGLRKPRKGYIF